MIKQISVFLSLLFSLFQNGEKGPSRYQRQLHKKMMKMSNSTNSSSLPEESDWVPTISHMPGQPVPVGTEKYQELCILVSPDHFTFTLMCWQEWYKCYLGGGQVIFTDGSVVDILQHHFTTTKQTRKVIFFSRNP